MITKWLMKFYKKQNLKVYIITRPEIKTEKKKNRKEEIKHETQK